MFHDKESEFWCYVARKKCTLQHLFNKAVRFPEFGTPAKLYKIFLLQGPTTLQINGNFIVGAVIKVDNSE